MTTIRRIVTSKIDGDSADNTDTNEVRPFGETAFYLDTNGNTNKLVLMMFDGARTHQKSKILSPGVLYGSNADSGDGAGLDTIKLIPDATLHYNFGDYNNHQHLVIDPTGPDHIHVRAGGPIDNSDAELFLGGELTHVRVSDNQGNVVIRTSIVGESTTSTDWVFGYDGALTLPSGSPILFGNGNSRIQAGQGFHINSEEGISLESVNVADPLNPVSHSWYFSTEGGLILPGGSAYITVEPDSGVSILEGEYAFDDIPTGAIKIGGADAAFMISSYDASVRTWNFYHDGRLQLPGSVLFSDGTTQTTAWSVTSVPVSSVGAAGDKQGDLAFDGSYMYYCTQDFAAAGYSSTITITHSGRFPSIVKGSIPQPQAGWAFVHNGTTYTLDINATDGNPGEWVCPLTTSISVTVGDTVTVGPVSSVDIWKRVAWSVDTW